MVKSKYHQKCGTAAKEEKYEIFTLFGACSCGCHVDRIYSAPGRIFSYIGS